MMGAEPLRRSRTDSLVVRGCGRCYQILQAASRFPTASSLKKSRFIGALGSAPRRSCHVLNKRAAAAK